MSALETGELARHPGDGWTLAKPYPMGARTRRALHGLIRAICPPVPHLCELEERIEKHIRCLMRYMHPILARGLWFSIHLLDWAPLWQLKSCSRLQRLDRDRGETILGALAASRHAALRNLLAGIRAFALSTFFDQREVHEALHYSPRTFMASRIALRKRLLQGQRPTASDMIHPVSEAAG